MNAIEVRNIVKTFGDFTAVKGISFAVEEGEIFGLLGPNGAGKSTLIRMMVTLLQPTAGTAVINGFDVVKQSDGVRQSIGVIPQAMTSDLGPSRPKISPSSTVKLMPFTAVKSPNFLTMCWTSIACIARLKPSGYCTGIST